MTEAVNEENSLWQNPKFIAYMGSTTFFNAGFSMQQLIISWLLVGVLLLPGDEVGLIQAAMGVPGLFLMLWGGASADNKDPRSILLNVYSVTWLFPLVLATCVYFDLLNIWSILLFGLAISTTTSFSSPAQQAILNHVAGSQVQRAVTASTAVMFLVQILSLAFAGQMDKVGLSTVLIVQAAAILLAAITTSRLDKTTPTPQPIGETSWMRLLNGFKATYNNKKVFHLLVINFISSIFNAGAFMTVVPFVVKRTYDGNALQLATIMIIFYFGATLTNLFMFKIMPIKRPGRWFLMMQLSRVIILSLLVIRPDWWLLIAAMFAWGSEYGPYDDAVTNNCPRIGGTRIQGADFIGLQSGADWQCTYWCYCAGKYHRDIRYSGGSYTGDAGFSCTIYLRRLFLAGLVLSLTDI